MCSSECTRPELSLRGTDCISCSLRAVNGVKLHWDPMRFNVGLLPFGLQPHPQVVVGVGLGWVPGSNRYVWLEPYRAPQKRGSRTGTKSEAARLRAPKFATGHAHRLRARAENPQDVAEGIHICIRLQIGLQPWRTKERNETVHGVHDEQHLIRQDRGVKSSDMKAPIQG